MDHAQNPQSATTSSQATNTQTASTAASQNDAMQISSGEALPLFFSAFTEEQQKEILSSPNLLPKSADINNFSAEGMSISLLLYDKRYGIKAEFFWDGENTICATTDNHGIDILCAYNESDESQSEIIRTFLQNLAKAISAKLNQSLESTSSVDESVSMNSSQYIGNPPFINQKNTYQHSNTTTTQATRTQAPQDDAQPMSVEDALLFFCYGTLNSGQKLEILSNIHGYQLTNYSIDSSGNKTRLTFKNITTDISFEVSVDNNGNVYHAIEDRGLTYELPYIENSPNDVIEFLDGLTKYINIFLNKSSKQDSSISIGNSIASKLHDTESKSELSISFENRYQLPKGYDKAIASYATLNADHNGNLTIKVSDSISVSFNINVASIYISTRGNTSEFQKDSQDYENILNRSLEIILKTNNDISEAKNKNIEIIKKINSRFNDICQNPSRSHNKKLSESDHKMLFNVLFDFFPIENKFFQLKNSEQKTDLRAIIFFNNEDNSTYILCQNGDGDIEVATTPGNKNVYQCLQSLFEDSKAGAHDVESVFNKAKENLIQSLETQSASISSKEEAPSASISSKEARFSQLNLSDKFNSL